MKHFFTILLGFVFLAAPALAQNPSPEAIMERARLSATLTKLDEGLTGKLTSGRNRVPIQIFLKGKNIQFQFLEGKSWRVFHMRLGNDQYELFEIINGKTVNFPRNKLVERIGGTDLTYEDLALRFFYWPNPKLEGSEKVGTEDCWKIRLNKPGGAAGNYEAVYVWVHKKFGAFMRIRGHDRSGTLIKEFQVENVMKVAKDVWTLRSMQVATHSPKTGRRQSITDMKLDKPTSGALKGLR